MLRLASDADVHGDILRGLQRRLPEIDLVRVQDAHSRKKCRDLNGDEPWACGDCDCTARLEARLAQQGCAFLPALRERASGG